MSRFNSEAYDKIFPRQDHQAPAPESAVEGFKPDNSPVDPITAEPEETKEDMVKPVIIPEPVEDPLLDPEEVTEGGTNNESEVRESRS